MEYATKLSDNICDDNYIKYVGYNQHICTSSCGGLCIKTYFSKNNRYKISRKITELLQGVDKYNRPIIIPDKTICNVMNAVYENFQPEIGDIHNRYIISSKSPSNYIQRMIDEVINIITTDVKVNLGIEKHNSTLSVWTTILGDFNKHGLRSHSEIKIRENSVNGKMNFNMNY